MGRWAVIIEGANTYSPDPIRQAARARMEREVYRQRGVLIVTDYLVNSGGVIFAAQEQMIKTPGDLRIPAEIFGNRPAVEGWCQEHAKELAELADKRQQAGELQREEIIRRNMRELVDLLIADPDLLPAEAAETITIRRIASRERDRRAAEIMVALPTIPALSTVRQAAERLVEAGSPILAVLDEKDVLTGVVTDWDITRASALGCPDDQPLEEIMTREVVSAAPGETIIDMIRKLERYEITAMPVVENGCVQGMVTADLLARKSLLRLLQSQVD
jgi:glutamate dehydrogenase (NAD(P)+)